MIRCHIPPEQLDASIVELDREEAYHLVTVLRAKPGTPVQLFDGQGHQREGRVAAVARRQVTVASVGAVTASAPPACALELYACLVKGKRMDWLVEKATELGVRRIVPVISEHTVVRPASEPEGPVARWRRITLAAARQCGTPWLPEIEPVLTFDAAVGLLTGAEVILAAMLIPPAIPLRDILDAWRTERPTPPRRVAYLVGPEGDFSSAESRTLLAAGAQAVSLGARVLRAETAALHGLSVLACEWRV